MDNWKIENTSGWGKTFAEYKCLKCGYSFGSEHINYEKGCETYEMIKKLATDKQREHENLCDPKRYIYS